MKKLLFLIVISFFIFPFIAVAKENDVIIESIELIEKSENAEELSTANIESNKVNVDLKLYDPGDYIEYNIKIKNVSEDEYKFDESKLKTSDEYVEYEFSYAESTNVLKPNEERTLKLKVTYKNKVPADKLENDAYSSNNKLVLTLIDGEIVPDIINPKTGVTNPIVYYIVGLISVIGLLTIFKVNRKYKLLSLLVITTLFIPLYTIAESKVDVDINAKITIDGKEAYLITGEEFNIKIKQLAGNDTSVDGCNTVDHNIQKFQSSSTKPTESNMESKNIVSLSNSPYPIYVWYDNGVIYWWSEDKSPNFNIDSSSFFRELAVISNIDGARNFDVSTSENINSMFYDDYNLENIEFVENWDVGNVKSLRYVFASCNLKSLMPLKNWDVSSAEDITGLFGLNIHLTSLEGLENWDVSNVKVMYGTFMGSSSHGNMYITSLEPLKNWDVSNVENMQGLFQRNYGLSNLKGLENWNVSNVSNMSYMFSNSVNLENIDALEKWNTGNVTTMKVMFSACNLKSLVPSRKWDVSNVDNMSGFIQTNINLTSLEGLEFWNTKKVQLFRNFCTGCTSLSDVSATKNFDISNTTEINNMFYGPMISEVDLSNYEFKSVTSTTAAGIFNSTHPDRIKTPKAYPENASIKIKLPGTYQDENGNTYTQLNNTSPTQVWLTKVS